MTLDTTEYWNEKYWKKYLEGKDDKSLDFLTDVWIDEYSEIIDKVPKGRAVDLGCGLGQLTQYFTEKGFDVTSCDISDEVLVRLQKRINGAKTVKLDMSKPLPFESGSLCLVVANLSIHYFSEAETLKIMSEIKRVLVSGGYFVGAVVSASDYRKNDKVVEIEPNFYKDEDGKLTRYWDKEQFDRFFVGFNFMVISEVTKNRFNRKKKVWEFIAKIEG